MSVDKHILKVGIVGYEGRMGKELLNVAEQRNISTITDDNKKKLFDLADIVIDFSSTDGLRECLQEVKRTGKPLVSGSTPMSDELYEDILEVSKEAKICWSSNMSIGVAIIRKMSYLLGKMLSGDEYDCEIVEKHHNQKLDAPSGTAKTIGQAVANGRGIDFNTTAIFGRTPQSGKRKIGEICFSSIRGGNIFGEHDVMFIGQDDEITISHKAFNRRLFAVGAINCALKLLKQKENGFYSVEDLLITTNID